MGIDIEQLEKFIEFLRGDPQARVTFQTFDDCKLKGHKRRDELSRVLHGTAKELKSTLEDLQFKGAGVFVMVNAGDLQGRSVQNVVSVSAYFYDEDEGREVNTPLTASLVVQSKNGPQGYFKAKQGQPLETFTQTQKLIAETLSTDPSVSDPNRVMRAPGTWHLKDPHSPYAVKIVETAAIEYTAEEIAEAFKTLKTRIKDESGNTRSKESQMDVLSSFFEEIGISEGPRTFDWLKFFEEESFPFKVRSGGLIIDIECPNESQHTSGHSLDTSTSLLIGTNGVRLKCQHGHCSSVTVVDLVKEYSAERLQWFCTKKSESRSEKLAKKFQASLHGPIRYYRDEWYVWTGSHYKAKADEWIYAEIIRYVQSHQIHFKGKIGTLASDILTHLKGIGVIPFEESPFWIEDPNHQKERLIPLKNGLFRVDEYIKFPHSGSLVIPHSNDYFSLGSLGFDFNPDAKCEVFLKFLNEVVPDQEIQRGLQEFIGSTLLREENFNVILFLNGQGANGKSVLLTVVRVLLGYDNVSAVGLEAFSPSRTFPLAATMGKFANIVAEIGDVSRAEEGVLKQYSSGDIITVERKHRDPLLMTPTAKLIFSTNNLPVFRDKTDGIYRRIFLIPMTFQVLDPAKQDKRLVDPRFWEASGEIEGLFVWALEGLKRLLQRGHFVVPKASEDAKVGYRSDLNPASRFLEENLSEAEEPEEIPTVDLYEAYCSWCALNGHRPQGETKFAEEVRRRFPKANYSQNALSRLRMRGLRKIRTRVWSGIKPIERLAFLDLLKDPDLSNRTEFRDPESGSGL